MLAFAVMLHLDISFSGILKQWSEAMEVPVLLLHCTYIQSYDFWLPGYFSVYVTSTSLGIYA